MHYSACVLHAALCVSSRVDGPAAGSDTLVDLDHTAGICVRWTRTRAPERAFIICCCLPGEKRSAASHISRCHSGIQPCAPPTPSKLAHSLYTLHCIIKQPPHPAFPASLSDKRTLYTNIDEK